MLLNSIHLLGALLVAPALSLPARLAGVAQALADGALGSICAAGGPSTLGVLLHVFNSLLQGVAGEVDDIVIHVRGHQDGLVELVYDLLRILGEPVASLAQPVCIGRQPLTRLLLEGFICPQLLHLGLCIPSMQSLHYVI